MKVAIIGSGLAAISVAKVLVKKGIKPVILDSGKILDDEKSNLVHKLSNLAPNQWSSDDIETFTSNPTVYNKKSLPQKLVFGSDYFYGKSNSTVPINGDGELPPFSYAKGGFSVGWGAAVLPPDECDLHDWPIGNQELSKYYSQVLSDLPYSAQDDELSLNFPLLSKNSDPLKLSKGNNLLLQDLRKSELLAKNKLVFGQSRLLVQASDYKSKIGCKYCGYCMSGCVYGCIYKSSQTIDYMIADNSIEYKSNILVQSLQEHNGKVNVLFKDKDNKNQTLSFNRVFLAAGAVNSTRIILESKKLYGHKIQLKTRGGFVAPMFRFKQLPIVWPDENTQPGLFLEFKVDELSDHWVHTQLSVPNELVYRKLNIQFGKKGVINSIKKELAKHLVVAFCNMHSDHANGYELSLKKSNINNNKMTFNRQDGCKANNDIKKVVEQLFQIGKKIGCYPLTPLIQNNTGSYHVGGTLPMKMNPELETETNLLGNPKGYNRIHVVDSSIFPSLPGTTIGLLAMANATRITSEIDFNS